MSLSSLLRNGWLPALLIAALLLSVSMVLAQDRSDPASTTAPPRGTFIGSQPNAGGQQPSPQRPYRLAERSVVAQPPVPNSHGAAQPQEHPLMPALRWAYSGVENIEKIQDYSATLVKRERINGKLAEPEYMFAKVRHNPFSVYLYFLGPPTLKGREVIYVDGQNNGKMWAHTTGLQDSLVGTVSLAPDSMLAMRGQRYPLTELGILNLVRRLVEVAEQDIKYGECEVKFFKGATINKRSCTCIQVMHPIPRRNFLFHLARIFIDDELNVPLRYEAYDWPKKAGDKPELIEEYTYLNLKLNNGFTDADFDIRNPNYNFKAR